MNAILTRWIIRGVMMSGVALASLTMHANQAKADGFSNNFSYYNPRTGMQYSQGYSMQGRNQSSSFYYGPPPVYRNSGIGYGNVYNRQSRYSVGYNHSYGYQRSQNYNKPKHCR